MAEIKMQEIRLCPVGTHRHQSSSVLCDKDIPEKPKNMICKTAICPAGTIECETWGMCVLCREMREGEYDKLVEMNREKLEQNTYEMKHSMREST